MDQPGLSLFQGGESIHVEGLGNAAAEEEDEDLIDRKRREDELGRQLQNAFDDLLDDDDETLDDSYQSGPSFRNHCGDVKREEQQIGGQKRHHISNEDEDDQEANSRENALYRLRMELQSKNNELDHVSMMLNTERQTSMKTIADLKNQLALSTAERDRLQMTKNQTHELLVESKTKICELDDAVKKLTERTHSLDSEKRDLILELENSRILLNDTQMKCHLMEKEIGRSGANNSRAQDQAFKQLTERNAAQVEVMQQQIDLFRNKLEAREVELRTMEEKYRDLEKTRQILLIEKTQTINDISEQMERAQRQCQELLSQQNLHRQSPRVNAENAQLRKKIADLESHIDDLQKTTDGLLRELDNRRDDFANVVESTPHQGKKQFLANAMNGLEATDKLANETKALRREVDEKATEIQNLIMTENALREELRRVRERTETCGRCNSMEERIDDLRKYNSKLEEQINDLQNENGKLANGQERDNRLVLEKMQEIRKLQNLLADQEQRNRERSREDSRESLSSVACQTNESSETKTSIIEEYAKLTAAEIKKIEEKYKREMLSAQQEQMRVKSELEELEKRHAEETDLFKEVILAEREEYEKLLAEKEHEVERLMVEREEMDVKRERSERENELLASLERELQKKRAEMEEERKSMALWRSQWREEKKQLLAIEEHLKKEMEVLRENWKSAKCTAVNYKLYSEEKDKFMEKEVERLRMEYDGVIEKLRSKCRRLERAEKRV